MTVEANGDVSLFGNLTQLPANTAPGQPKTQPGFDEAYQRLIQAAMFNAIGATGTSIVNAIISGGDVGPLATNLGVSGRSVERRVGNGWVSMCNSRWWPAI